MAFVAKERLRGTTIAPPIPATGECTNAFQGSPTLATAKGKDEHSDVPGDSAQTLGDVSAGVAPSDSAECSGNGYDDAEACYDEGGDYEDYHYEDGYDNEDELHGEEEAYSMLLVRTGEGGSSSYLACPELPRNAV